MERARAGGVSLTGEGGPLQQLTKRVLKSALDGELTAHLGHGHGERSEGGRENCRNGHRRWLVCRHNTRSLPVAVRVPPQASHSVLGLKYWSAASMPPPLPRFGCSGSGDRDRTGRSGLAPGA